MPWGVPRAITCRSGSVPRPIASCCSHDKSVYRSGPGRVRDEAQKHAYTQRSGVASAYPGGTVLFDRSSPLARFQGVCDGFKGVGYFPHFLHCEVRFRVDGGNYFSSAPHALYRFNAHGFAHDEPGDEVQGAVFH